MTIIIFCAVAYGIYKLLSVFAHRMERIEAEQAAQHETDRQRDRMIIEQARKAAEHDRTIAVLAKEQRKQAEQIAKMQQTVKQCSADIEYLTDHQADLYAQLDYYLLQQSGTIPGSKTFEQYQNKIVSIKTKLHSTESRLSKAQFNQAQAQRKLA